MSGHVQTRKHCRTCERPTLHGRPAFSNAAGCFLTLLTFGLFLPFWILAKVAGVGSGPWRCQVCGTGRYF